MAVRVYNLGLLVGNASSSLTLILLGCYSFPSGETPPFHTISLFTHSKLSEEGTWYLLFSICSLLLLLLI